MRCGRSIRCVRFLWMPGQVRRKSWRYPAAELGSVGRARRVDQKMVTPYVLAASRTGWKKVVPPLVQSPLPPEVRPSAFVPS